MFYNSRGKINVGAIVARLFPKIERLMLLFRPFQRRMPRLFILININCAAEIWEGSRSFIVAVFELYSNKRPRP